MTKKFLTQLFTIKNDEKINRTQYWKNLFFIILSVIFIGVMFIQAGLPDWAFTLVGVLSTWPLMISWIKRCNDVGIYSWLALLGILPHVGLPFALTIGLLPSEPSGDDDKQIDN